MFSICFSLTKVRFVLHRLLIMRIVFCRYQFLVYNASVIYFNYIRPFFRDGYRQYLCTSFQHVVDVLMSVPDEQDFLWQAELLL